MKHQEIIPHKPRAGSFERALKSGRLEPYWIDANGTNMCFMNIYGWTGGVKGNLPAERTNDLLDIINAETKTLHHK